MAYKAHFLDVGCADCTIFEMGDDLVLIDCGYNKYSDKGISKPTNIAHYINNNIGKSLIDLLIISHPHSDHYLGMEDLINNFTVAEFWGSPYKRRHDDNSLSLEDYNEYTNLKNKLVPDSSKRFTCSSGVRKNFTNCNFLVLGPRTSVNDSDTRECHDANLVIWVSTPANNFIVCGDASDSELDLILADWKLTNCNVLRASHHGSKNGANLEFIKTASPRDTIISTKSGIFDNVPDSKALRIYDTYSSKVFRTDVEGLCTTPLIANIQ